MAIFMSKSEKKIMSEAADKRHDDWLDVQIKEATASHTDANGKLDVTGYTKDIRDRIIKKVKK